MPQNASFQGYFTEVSFDTSEENQLSVFQMAIFSKFLDGVMSHINADKKIKSIFKLFITQNIEFKFVLFSMVQTLFYS